MRARLILAVGAAAALAASIAWAAQVPEGQPQPPPDGKAILEGACTMCHGVDFIVERRKDRDAWDFTVHRMMDKGADLSVDEADLLIDYLARTYPKPAAPP